MYILGYKCFKIRLRVVETNSSAFCIKMAFHYFYLSTHIQIDDKILPSFLFLISDGELYSATVSDFSGSDPLIYKRALENDQEPLRTDQFDSKHLNCK